MANKDNNFANTLKLLTMNALAESKPTDLVIGTVVNLSPLSIQVDDKLIIDEDFLILSDQVKTIEREVDVDWDTEKTMLDFSHDHTATSKSVSSSSSTSKSASTTSSRIVNAWVEGNSEIYVNSHWHYYSIPDHDNIKTGSTSTKGTAYTQGKRVNGNLSSTTATNTITTTDTLTNTTTVVQKKELKKDHLHEIKGRKKITIHNELKMNERVAMIRFSNGQMYYVLDRA